MRANADLKRIEQKVSDHLAENKNKYLDLLHLIKSLMHDIIYPDNEVIVRNQGLRPA
jgi:hypothetical protein